MNSTTFPFDVRPFARETLENYGRRLFEANFSTEAHFVALTRQAQEGTTKNDVVKARHEVLRAHTERGALHFEADPTGWLTHGPTKEELSLPCEHFGHQLPRRNACTQCARGELVEQYPHFDRIVCIKHKRWLGLWGRWDAQFTVDPDSIRAQMTFAKLRKSGRLDLRLYLLLIKSLGDDLAPNLPLDETEPVVFAHAIRVAHAITTSRFARLIFDLSQPLAASHGRLSTIIRETTGEERPSLVMALWAYLRPTFDSLHAYVLGEHPSWRTVDHEYPLRTAIAEQLVQFHGTPDAMANYLAASGDDSLSYAKTMARSTCVHDTVNIGPVRSFTCSEGHTFDYLPPNQLPDTILASTFVPTCGICAPNRVKPGKNDLVTLAPKIASQFDPLRNGGLTARNVAANSSIKRWWLCEAGHSHEVSPSHKTQPGYTCAICDDRIVRPGLNSILTTHPEYARMWAEPWKPDESPALIAASSNLLRYWACGEGHRFPARPWELTTGKRGCIICARADKPAWEDSLAATHPQVAELLHPELNDGLTPAELTHGERREVYWSCPNNDAHAHKSRIDKMSLGQKCPVCASRKLRVGENDLATTDPILVREYHPYHNRKAANEIFPSDHVLVWKCLVKEHLQNQTVQNRRNSGGCSDCPKSERILYKENLEIDEIAT
jgi:hypothetical protein